jgi:hypothetical protein
MQAEEFVGRRSHVVRVGMLAAYLSTLVEGIDRGLSLSRACAPQARLNLACRFLQNRWHGLDCRRNLRHHAVRPDLDLRSKRPFLSGHGRVTGASGSRPEKDRISPGPIHVHRFREDSIRNRTRVPDEFGSRRQEFDEPRSFDDYNNWVWESR